MAESSHHCGQSSTKLLPRLSIKCDPNDCPRGDPGFRGPRGDSGSKGTPGNDGEVGPQGQAGQDSDTVGLSDYAEYYTQIFENATLVVEKDTRVYFKTTAVNPISGAISRGNDASEFILAPGVYRISWRVPTSSPGALRLNVNGEGLDRTTTTGSNHSCEITNTVLLEIQATHSKFLLQVTGLSPSPTTL